MNLLKLFIVIAAFAFLTAEINAQGISGNFTQDALTYSQLSPGGTARMWGMGKSGTSLGGDISAITANPAGLGFYNKSQFAVTAALKFNNVNTSYLGSNSTEFSPYFNIPNIGIVFNSSSDASSFDDWKGGSFGISINQQENLRGNLFYRGTMRPNDSGFMDDFIEYALQPFLDENGNFLNFSSVGAAENYAEDQNIYSQLAFNTFLLDIFGDDANGYEIDRYDSNFPNTPPITTQSSLQSESIITSGGITSLSGAYGGNFKDQLFIGAGFNIMFVNQGFHRTYTERPEGTELTSFTLEERTAINGAGFNANLGLIYKPIPQINIGVNYRTSTYYRLSETIELDMTTNFDDGDVLTDGVTIEVPSYNFRSPHVFSGGATYFFNKNGFLTADVEYLPLQGIRFDSQGMNLQTENSNLRQELRDIYTLRFGGEYRVDIFRFRAGAAVYSDPFQSPDFTQNRYSLNGGFGVRKSDFFTDIAVSYENRAINPFLPYSFSSPQADSYRFVEGGISNVFAVFTLGWNF